MGTLDAFAIRTASAFKEVEGVICGTGMVMGVDVEFRDDPCKFEGSSRSHGLWEFLNSLKEMLDPLAHDVIGKDLAEAWMDVAQDRKENVIHIGESKHRKSLSIFNT